MFRFFEVSTYLFWDSYRFFMALFTGKKLKVSKEVQEHRLSVCEKCPNLKREGRFVGYVQKRCGICSCYLKIKTILATEHCPDEQDRWMNG